MVSIYTHVTPSTFNDPIPPSSKSGANHHPRGFTENDIASLPLPEGFPSVMRIDLASGDCSAVYDEPQPPPKDPTLPSKVSLTKNENFVALGNPLKSAIFSNEARSHFGFYFAIFSLISINR